MNWGAEEATACKALVDLALAEDLGDRGDITSATIIREDMQGNAVLVARAPGIVAGLPPAQAVFVGVDPAIAFSTLVTDGTPVRPGDRLAVVAGPQRSILVGERTALNFLQRLSGIATLTRRYVEAVAGLPVRILDTRKTTPGWRRMEKYAVRCGGGHNHRMGLFDGVMIKDNHLAAYVCGADAVHQTVRIARAALGNTVPIELEVDSLDQLEEAFAASPDIILLDNMDVATLTQAVRMRNMMAKGIRLEASGGVTLPTVRDIAETGVDDISIGALTHSAVALDIALDEEPPAANST